MDYHIRKGHTGDIEGVFSLVKELAEFEKAPDEVITTEAEYLALYKEGLFDFLVAESNEKIVGIALYYFTFSTWKGKMLFLEDFVVRQELRGIGIGKALFDGVIEQARKTDCALMKWEVLDWNENAIRFYEKYDATIEKNWWDGKLFFR
ncbi:GNAT family N-acetyltransferase [Membranicola marinus]|uniref:GNAT family N-acetyltransferase n=1 Tax=Membranihabitans marinus TaxID=1227546 RepID=A0A953HSQ6_9BACT|nr:GNAT family N-acetyltransferase [Membranihabitans marinus]MBY5957695.1 GNAT family N-acetyltransferase [Membranihabitans marinus]